MDENNKNRIDDLNNRLYSRTNAPHREMKSRLKDESYSVEDDWQHERETLTDPHEENMHHSGGSFFKKIFIGSILFFIIALGLATFILFRGQNIVSATNVDINVKAPVSVAAGDVLSMDIDVKNKNTVALETVDVVVDFPAGTADPADTAKELRHFRQTMDDITPSSSGSKSVKAVLYGQENEKKDIKITVEYRVKGSNAVFYKEKTYELYINSSPVTVSIDSFDEINSGQQLVLNATVTSNSKDPLKNVLLRAEYPFGFSFDSSDPQPTYDNNVWSLGNLQPLQKRTFKIVGKLEGQDDEDRVFKFGIGTQSAKSEKQIGTQYLTTSQTVKIKRPFLAVKLGLDSPDADVTNYVGQNGKVVRGYVSWVNNLTTNIENAVIELKLSGNAYDRNAVTVSDGFFRSSDNTIVWNTSTSDKLKLINPGEKGSVAFTITPQVAAGIQNPQVAFNISVKGVRSSQSNVSGEIANGVSKTIKIAPSIDLQGQIVRTVGPFANTGPVPPRADLTTTYTITWTVSNTSSAVINAEVHANLPPYIKYLSKYSPDSEKFTFNPASGELVWKVGDLRAYTGKNGVRKELSFQVGLQPSINQVGDVPLIINQATLSADDQYTGTKLTATRSALTSRFSTDPSYRIGDEVVGR